MKIPSLKNLFHSSCFCKKTKKILLVEKINEIFTKGLDIRSFIQVHTKLSLLVRLLLTEQQRVLFKYNHHLSLPLGKLNKRAGAKLTSSSDDDELSFKVADLTDSCKIMKRMRLLRGFKAETDFDKQLLRGIFGRKSNIKSPYTTHPDIAMT